MDSIKRLLAIMSFQDGRSPLSSEVKFRLLKLSDEDFRAEMKRMEDEWQNCHYVKERRDSEKN